MTKTLYRFGCSLRLFLGVAALILASNAFAQEDPTSEAKPAALPGAEQDSLFASGERQFKAGELDTAAATFTRLVAAYPKEVTPLVRLGHVYLKKGDFEAAEKAFKDARKLDKTRPDVHVGLGLIHAERPARGVSAFYNFRRAVGEAKRAISFDSTYAPAYRVLGEVYERFREDHEKSIQYYMKYVTLEPDDPDGLYYFGLACVQAEQYDKIDRYLASYLKEHPQDVRLLPLVAQGYFYTERYELALEFFERYLQQQDEQERALYVDISLIASEKELDAYNALPEGAERLAYLDQFWRRRDPDILTKINERIIEHYRRIWYARTFFSDKIYPWDRRGEVYIRYGEPDYRSRSFMRQFVQSPKVDAVRTRMAVELYGPEAAFLTYTGPVFPIRTYHHPATGRHINQLFDDQTQFEEPVGAGVEDPEPTSDDDVPDLPELDRREMDEQDGARFDEFGNLSTRLNFDGYAPVTLQNDLATVSWEAWTYVQVQGGIEIVFTDEMGNGQYDFAPIPPVVGNENQMRVAARVIRNAPEVIYENAAAIVPDYYRPGVRGEALDFYFDLADFQGADGQTTVEVYYGIPPEQVEIVERADSAQIFVQCSLALADEGHTTIYRTAEDFLYQDIDDINRVKGAFLPELLKVEVPPGKYELQVQLRDQLSRRVGIYKQALEVSDYRSDALLMSKILLASSIEDTMSAEKFRKRGVWVVPMPTRNYLEAQKVYAYYEIYNLKPDTFGATQYKVQYLVRSSSSPAAGILDVVTSGLRSLFKSRKPQVSITYEQTGSGGTEQEYFEIDLSKAKPGLKMLEVMVTDLVSGESSEREIHFRYGE